MTQPDALDVPLVDVELLAEISLTTGLIIAAQTFDRQLTREETDMILEVRVRPASAAESPTYQARG